MNRKQRRAAKKQSGPPASEPSAAIHQLLVEAVRLHQAGAHGEAERLYRQVLARKPDFAEAHAGLADALLGQGRLDEAGVFYRNALDHKPHFPEVLGNLGAVLKIQGRLDDAVACFRKAVALKGDFAGAYSNLGAALREQRKLDEAADACRRAIELRPDYPEALGNLGNILREQGRLDEAVAWFRKALALSPGLSGVHNNLGSSLMDQGRLDDAIVCYRTALSLTPGYWEAHSNLIMALHYSEQHFDKELPAALRFYVELMERASAGSPPASGGARTSRSAHDRSHDADLEVRAPMTGQRTFANLPDPDRRLRIGYVSGDLRAHPVGYILGGVLAAHDPAAVETFCYSSSAVVDAVTAGLRGAAHQWRTIAGRSVAEVDAMIRQDRIDILVDLAGHTANNRLAVFAARAAPVQATWAGYFGTTGLEAMDWILADRFVVPPGEEALFSETVWRLPDSYFCFALPPEVPILERPAGELMLGSFNNWTKVSDGTVALWARVLSAIPGSRLLLKTRFLDNPEVERDAVARFARQGIGPDRLILEGPAPREDLLAAYNRMDIALDPFPFGGGMTTLEALWMGVPVVTQRGHRWVARVGESILATAGLPDLVAADADGYVRLVEQLAADRTRLADLRRSLRPMLTGSPLCDGPRFARSLEAAYRAMWRNWCARRGNE